MEYPEWHCRVNLLPRKYRKIDYKLSFYRDDNNSENKAIYVYNIIWQYLLSFR